MAGASDAALLGSMQIPTLYETLRIHSSLQSAVSPLKSAIEECLEIAQVVPLSPEDLGVQAVAKKLEDLAGSLGLHFFNDDTGMNAGSTSVCIAGNFFVVDVCGT